MTSKADVALKKRDYDLAFQLYQNEIKAFELKNSPTSNEQANYATAILRMAFAKSMIVFNHINTIHNLTQAENEILIWIEKAQDILQNLNQKGLKVLNFNKVKEKIYNNIRNCYWNEADYFMNVQNTSPLFFTAKKNLYLHILNNLQKFLDYTMEMQIVDLENKEKNILAAKEYLAEVHDWLSDLYYDSVVTSKTRDEVDFSKLTLAMDYNQKSVALWTAINPDKDILILHLGYLNILHCAFEKSKDQNYLQTMSDYMALHLNKEFTDERINIEIKCHKFMVALNRIPLDKTLTKELSEELLALKTDNNADNFSYYFDLANKYLVSISVRMDLPTPSSSTQVKQGAKRQRNDSEPMNHKKTCNRSAVLKALGEYLLFKDKQFKAQIVQTENNSLVDPQHFATKSF